MNSIHDMGGMHGFGRVEREANEPVFHAPWESRMFGISRACVIGGIFNQDEGRHGIERMSPAAYLATGYYERWLARTERLLVEKGLLGREELAERIRLLGARPNAPLPVPPPGDRPPVGLPDGERFRRAGPVAAFRAGERVRTKNAHPVHHTRLPRYARAKLGVIHRVHGGFVFPDTNAHGLGEQPQVVYSVRFDARELWSESAEPNQSVYLDLFESYLEPAEERP